MKTDEILHKVAADPHLLNILKTCVLEPQKAIDSLDLLIRRSNTNPEVVKRYQNLRNAIERYMNESKKVSAS